jgi:hypothetical protein
MDNYSCSPVVANCIFWGNTPDTIYNTTSDANVSYSDVEGGWGGEGGNNINADPCFVDEVGGNLRLTSGSPCVDAGDNAAASGITTDLDGNPRVVDGDTNATDIVDMGAYEYMPGGYATGAASLEECWVLAAQWLEKRWDLLL